MSGYRLAKGGSGIDRGRRLGFRFAGARYQGFDGDTLASALLANGVDVVARSFKYHRPRGVYSAGPEEPNALVTLGEGARAEPNAKAPFVPLTEGLVASAQNAWPSLNFDMMAANSLAGKLFAAGFYYKTFIGGPRGTWTRLFEPVIRRAAGMGRAPVEPDPDRYETMHAHCDVLVVGAGPTGLMAAKAAASCGARVIVADEREAFGGMLRHDRALVDGLPAPEFAAGAQAELAALGATVLPRTTVYGHYDGQFGAVERVADVPEGDFPRQRHWLIRPRQVILATGAIERPIVFAGNDRPGVMLADAGRAYVNQHGVAPGRRVVVFGCHDGAYAAVRDLAEAGVEVVAVVDPRREPGAAARDIADRAGAELIAGAVVSAARGKVVRSVEVRSATGTRAIEADALLVSGGWVPTLHLTSQAGGKPIFDEALAAFRPGALPENWQAVGAVDAMFATADCLAAGARAGREAAQELGFEAHDLPAIAVEGDAPSSNPHPLFHVPGKGKAFVDMQHDVTASDVALAHDEGFRAVEHLKRYTTLGMATDQGKTSNLNGLAMMAELTASQIPQVGTTRFRPPTTPIAIGALAGASTGSHVRPVRRTPMQEYHEANGGEMVAAGAYLRPRAYLREGEDVHAAYLREAAAVRSSVGIVDVSTLGKIEVAGPDAATLLDRVYINGFAKLPVGKARYGIMLRDDGFVFDDGTTWRLAEHRYLMTTTTANAAKVLTHLETLLAVAWPELKVHVTSVSEQWAAMAIAGPRSRAVLARVMEDADLTNEGCPFMAIRHGTIAGVKVMTARLSFSGELAYEVYCGAHHGRAVWDALLEAGEADGIVPYGTEAMGTLRIEKGHVAGPELDGRTTVDDLGLARMASKKKHFVGSVMRRREALTAPDRLSLVGLRSLDGRPIRTGAHLVASTGSQGHVTSSTGSPELGGEIALGLLANGPARHGERLTATYPLKGINVPVEVVAPVFVDPEGSRMHG